MYRLITVLVLTLVAGGTQLGADDKALAAAAKKFEGTWQVASAEHNGAPASAEGNKGLRLVVEGDGYENRRDGMVISKGTYKFVGQKDQVFHLDLTSSQGPDKGKVLRLIAEWVDGDTLRVSGPAEVGGERPTQFTGGQGSKQELITFKRVKP
jgi:uncharacterized protein (TIGR03067 family)